MVYIPQLTTPDPRSIAKSLRVRAYQVRDLPTIHNGSGISSGCITSRTSMLVQPEFFPGAVIIMPHTPGGNSYLILSYNQSQELFFLFLALDNHGGIL